MTPPPTYPPLDPPTPTLAERVAALETLTAKQQAVIDDLLVTLSNANGFNWMLAKNVMKLQKELEKAREGLK